MFYVKKVYARRKSVNITDSFDAVSELVSQRLLNKLQGNLIMGQYGDEFKAVTNQQLVDAYTSEKAILGVSVRKSFGIDAGVLKSIDYDMQEIEVPYGVYKIETSFPRGCTKVVLPTTLERISSRVFFSCSDLQDVVIPYGVKTIASQAFFATGLVSVVIPDSVHTIGDNCFACCAYLKKAVLSKNLTVLGSNCFSSCYSLEQIDIPEGVQGIGSGAFSNCGELKEVVFPSTCQTIGRFTFAHCASLRRVTILVKDSIHIAEELFVDMDKDKLVLVGYKGSDVEEYAYKHGIKFEVV